ncbi:unnamed protein product [Absidia cylindrospora]
MDPVHFDSVFNQSRHTWSFGSPDILPMFQHEASSARVDVFMYPPEFEVFAGDASYLDTWVFDHVKTLFQNASSFHDNTLDQQLRQDKNVFFLHLLGLDTNGHAHRPYSEEYYNNIGLVDRGIKKMVDLFEDFYGHDNKTSYIFTADHGMNNRGAHGDGHPENTRTPIIAWGAGIRAPILSSEGDHASSTWKLDQYRRQDVLQADIAPLMAHLIGIPFPANSVGQLPLSYLDADDHSKAEAAFTNARTILAEYEMKRDGKKDHELFFRPFRGLSGEHTPQSYVTAIQQLINSHEYRRAEEMSRHLIELSLEGLQYFQTYNWFFLRIVITAGFIGWCFYCLEFVLRLYSISCSPVIGSSRVSNLAHAISLLVYFALAGIIWVQKMPSLSYAYVFFPVFFWNHIIQNLDTFQVSGSQFISSGYSKSFGVAIGIALTLETLVYSFFVREMLTIIFILISFWPLVMPGGIRRNKTLLLVGWTLCCYCTSIFTALPVEMDANIMLVVYGGLLGLILGLLSVLSLRLNKRIGKQSILLLLAQLATNGLSIALVYLTAIDEEKLSLWNQISNWGIVCTSSIYPFIYLGKSNQDYLGRLLTICFALAPLMTLLSTSYEMLFYVSLCATLLIWLEMERELYRKNSTAMKVLSVRPLQSGDIRPVLFFLFFITVSFFGTGNVASLGSFTLESVYRFVTVYDSFLMGSLLIVKVLVPFVVVASIFGVLTISLDLSPFSLFLCVVTITDIQTIHFFYLVSDHGDWLNIGINISHFCIAELFTIFTIILFFLSRWLVGHVSSSAAQPSHYLYLHY